MNDRKKIIIRVDGGICSQIAFVFAGLYLADKFRNEAVVKFDLSWFRDCGKDMYGKFVRNWDFPKAFPNVACEEATEDEIRRLSRYALRSSDIETCRAPLYVGGYPDVYPAMCKMAQSLKSEFTPEMDEVTRRFMAYVAEGPTCAVHVRRGDLSTYSPAYGQPATVDYFKKAVTLIRGLEPATRFLFFSDELDWVEKELLSVLPEGGSYMLAEGHGSDSGYLDLYLISHCDYIISSSGSLGVFGAMLSNTCKALVMNRNRTYAFKYLKNVIYLNDSYFEVGPPPERPHGLRGLFLQILQKVNQGFHGRSSL